MTDRAIDIVVTTIFEPTWLDGYLENLDRHGHAGSVTLRIICDRKTPGSVFDAAAGARKRGFKVDCPTLEEQADFLSRLKLPESFIPWNTDNRRNVGFLRAWESGADVLISIDDDNYCRPDSDFVGTHLSALTSGADPSTRIAEGGRWFNVCSLLEMDGDVRVHPRGFPYAARTTDDGMSLRPAKPEDLNRPTVLNAGLWLDDPDVDAITRLALRPRARAAVPGTVRLGPDVWSPVNTQNTALVRAALPAYYYVRMGFPLRGMRIDRFGDILSGYFLQKCAGHLGHALQFGPPVADHRRTPHDLLQDLSQELAGILLIEDLLPWLQDTAISGATYEESYASLADALAVQAPRFQGGIWGDGGRDFLLETSECMKQWLRTLNKIGT